MNAHPFVTGGPVLPDSPAYIERNADEKARQCLRRMEYIKLIEPRQQGKTSLIHYLARTLGPGYIFAYVNVMRLEKTEEAAWYASLCRMLVRKIPFIAHSDCPSFPHNGSAWGDFTANLAERANVVGCNLVIALDEIEDVRMEWRVGFFSNIRAIFDERPDEPCFRNLTFILAGAYNPYALMGDPRTSPFNVAQQVHMPDFTLPQTSYLVGHLRLPAENAVIVAQQIHYWTDGQPYLTQCLCRALAEGEASATPEGIDLAVDRLFREDTNHLPRILEALDPDKHPGLREYIKRVMDGHRPQFRPASESRYHGPLALIGVLKSDDDGRCKVRNRIYEQALQGAVEMLSKSSFTEMHQALLRLYDLEELRTLCVQLGVGFDDLRGEGRQGKARELILLLERQRRIGELVAFLRVKESGEPSIDDRGRMDELETMPTTAQPAPPSVSVSLLTYAVPTAYCHHLDASAFPLIAVTLDNTGQGCANAALRVSTAIEGYSDEAITSPRVPQGEQIRVSLLPVLKPAAVATLNEIRPATLRVTVERTAPVERTLYDQTERIHLHARDTAILAVKAPDGSIVDLTEYLAAWVTPHRLEIEELLRVAAEHHPNRQFLGYQGASTLAQGAEIVRGQAQAIFIALKQDAKMVYINSPLNLGEQAEQITQRVRLPTESLAAGSAANCIDGTVLFASLLELASIDSFIVIVPGHAFVGWRTWHSVNRYEFLETTMIGSDDFDAAQQVAQARYDEVLMKGYFSRGLFDPGGFARLIDVAACRAKGINPLE